MVVNCLTQKQGWSFQLGKRRSLDALPSTRLHWLTPQNYSECFPQVNPLWHGVLAVSRRDPTGAGGGWGNLNFFLFFVGKGRGETCSCDGYVGTWQTPKVISNTLCEMQEEK